MHHMPHTSFQTDSISHLQYYPSLSPAASLPGMVAGVIKSFWETVSDYISLSPEESLTSHPLGDTHPNREEEASVSER